MDADAIALAKGAEVYKFDFAHADVADTFSFSAKRWAPYSADATVVVGDSITPQLDASGQSVTGSIKFSIPLGHLTQYASAHVEWDGAGFTVSYSLDGGTTWTLIDDFGAIALDPATNPDLDFSVGFDAGQTDAALNSLTIYVLKSDTLTSTMQAHAATFTADVINGSAIVLDNGMLELSPDAHDTPVNFGTIEMWSQMGSAGVLVDNTAFRVSEGANSITFSGCTVYVDGSPISSGAPMTSQNHHVVIVLPAPINTTTRIAEALDGTGSMDLTLSHLALYPNCLTAQDVSALYAAQSGLPQLIVNDPGLIAVTESSPAVDIYSYVWSLVTGSSA